MSIITLTGVSGSGKSTIQEKLINEYGFIKPINFTTRKPRSGNELDEYVFLTKPQFLKKLENGDFLEHNIYNGNYYALSKYIDFTKDIVMIVDPVGLVQLNKYFRINNIPYTSVLLTIDEETFLYRLGFLRRESVATIEDRKKDFKYFNEGNFDLVIDGTSDINTITKRIIQGAKNKTI